MDCSSTRSGIAAVRHRDAPVDAVWEDVRLIDTVSLPARSPRRSSHTLRGGTRRWSSTCTWACAAPDGDPGSPTALRYLLPELLALSASSPFHEGVHSGLHSTRTQVFTRFFPRCGIPDSLTRGRSTSATSGSSTRRAQSRSTRRLVEGPAAPRVPDRRDPDLRRSAGGRRVAGPRRPCRVSRPRGSRVRTTRACPSPPCPPSVHRGERLESDPLRPVRRAHRLRTRRVDPGEAAARGARRVGAARRGGDRRRAVPRRCPSGMPPSVRSSASRSGASLEEIYAEQVTRDRGDRWLTSSGSRPEDELREALDRIGVADILLNALSAAASIGFQPCLAGGARPRAGEACDRVVARAEQPLPSRGRSRRRGSFATSSRRVQTSSSHMQERDHRGAPGRRSRPTRRIAPS